MSIGEAIEEKIMYNCMAAYLHVVSGTTPRCSTHLMLVLSGADKVSLRLLYT